MYNFINMKNKILALSTLLMFPVVSYAQGDAQTMITTLVDLINNYVIILLGAIAFLFFIVNIIRYFVIESSEQEGRKKAKALAFYGVAAFVIIVIFWGIIDFFAESIGLDGNTTPDEFDYVTEMSGP